MKLALYQGPSPKGDIECAFKTVEVAVSSAASAGAAMIVFPELFLPGYNQPDLHTALAQPEGDVWERRLSAISGKHACGLTIGWAEANASQVFNSVSCFDRTGRKVIQHRKLQLFGPMEKSVFQVGNAYTTFELEGMCAAVLICYDVEFAHHVSALKARNVELLLVPTANAQQYDNVPDILVPARAAENRMTIVYANYCGLENEIVYGGKSVIVGPNAEILAKAGRGETILIANLDVVHQLDSTFLSTQTEDRREPIV